MTFSIVGYNALDVSVKDNNYSQVTLYAAENKMDEVVVIGYGTTKRKDLTGAVSSVKADDIVRSPAHNAMEALQGQVPGLDIVRNSGKATSGVTMNIRGKRSLSTAKDEYGNLIANNPLIIIDGVQGAILLIFLPRK